MPLRGRSRFTDENFFFVPTTVRNHITIFDKNIYCDILIENIKHYQTKYKFQILAYVIMPSHFHWIVETTSYDSNISDLMRDIKKYSAWDLMDQLEKDGSNKMKVFRNPLVKGQKRQFGWKDFMMLL